MALATVAQVKEYLATFGPLDDKFDALLERLVESCSADFEGQIGRTVAATERTEPRLGNGKTTLLLHHYPIVSVASVTVDGAAVTTEVADADAGILSCDSGFSRGAEVVVTYTAGYASVPKDVEQAVVELVAIRFGDRQAGSSVMEAGGGMVTDRRGAYGNLAHVAAVVERYRRPGIG